MASGRLSQADIDQIFDVFDADKSGTISAEEYRTALIAMGHNKVTAVEASEMMGGKSSLNREEFAQVIQQNAEEPNSLAEARRAFRLFDPKGTGRINQDLLLKAGAAATGATPSMDLVQRILSACDQDGDGYLDFDEFLAAVTIKLRINMNQGAPSANAAASAAAGGGGGGGSAEGNNLPAGSQLRKICGRDAVFNAEGKMSQQQVRDHLTKLDYSLEQLSEDALTEIFGGADKDNDGLIDEAEYKEILVTLGEED